MSRDFDSNPRGGMYRTICFVSNEKMTALLDECTSLEIRNTRVCFLVRLQKKAESQRPAFLPHGVRTGDRYHGGTHLVSSDPNHTS